MYFSFARLQADLKRSIVIRIVRRTILIFFIGTVLHVIAVYTWSTNFRIMGVLQRIALAYGTAALILLFIKRRIGVLLSAAGLVLVYWGLLVIFGGDAPYSVEQNAVRRLDLLLLGAKQMYTVDGMSFDPEGLLSTLPSVASVLLGFEATRFLKSQSSQLSSVLALGAIGVACIGAGWAWGFVWPVNKALWTGSFVVLTTGWALVMLALFVLLMDVGGFQLTPLQAFGMNPLFLYVFSSLWMTSYHWIKIGDASLFSIVFGFFLGGEEPSQAASFLYAISHVGLFWIVAALLYRNRIVIKV
jgi:predicted acyltransferase